MRSLLLHPALLLASALSLSGGAGCATARPAAAEDVPADPAADAPDVTPRPPAEPPPPPPPSPLDAAGERYLRLVLALGEHGRDDVDAYYGPAAVREEVKAEALPLAEVRARAEALAVEVHALPEPGDALEALRRRFLLLQLRAVATRARMLAGERFSFDEESERLYAATAPEQTEKELKANLAELERALPGKGALADRLERFRLQFAIPKEKLEPVFRAAIDEARRRTAARIELPEGESFQLEFVTGKPWSGYNWYQGDLKSLIQVNTDLPIFLWRAVDLAAHEGYPGHHVYNALLEQRLVRERGWREFTVYPLFSPMSLIAEGSANYGIEVAFPDVEAFTRDVLFPIAGVDPARAADYVRVERLALKLSYAGNEAARRYLEGRLPREKARDWLVKYALMSKARADQRMDFFDTYRSYVINYNLGKDLVKAYVERQGGTPEAPEKQWEAFRTLLSTPLLAPDLR
jgi:hypothetical protein